MGKFIKKYIDYILIFVALLMSAALVWVFIYTTSIITTSFTRVVEPVSQAGKAGTNFELEKLKGLDLRGLNE